MSENKQRKIVYFEIALLTDKSTIRARAREGKDFSKISTEAISRSALCTYTQRILKLVSRTNFLISLKVLQTLHIFLLFGSLNFHMLIPI